ncbi:hypothetical protein SAMN04487988_1212 [Algoriphagus hitonicola]|uniref:Uncharacterized protein n=1 Tax=Algoriphagus hitonicola TaxID=435880 RepID=A0A1I2XN19_9BACT|nr:hypothetical protein SAMN04487988_1212 [Algoriphagus hitonicola]
MEEANVTKSNSENSFFMMFFGFLVKPVSIVDLLTLKTKFYIMLNIAEYQLIVLFQD